MFPLDTKMLIVDDSTYARSMLKKSLTDLKFSKVLDAKDVSAARKFLEDSEVQKDPVHLLICDLHMPEVSGLEFLRWIRTQPKWKSLPVIVITSSQEKAEIFEAGRLGVSHYMIKPFDTKTLRDKLSSTWEKHGAKYAEALKA